MEAEGTTQTLEDLTKEFRDSVKANKALVDQKFLTNLSSAIDGVLVNASEINYELVEKLASLVGCEYKRPAEDINQPEKKAYKSHGRKDCSFVPLNGDLFKLATENKQESINDVIQNGEFFSYINSREKIRLTPALLWGKYFILMRKEEGNLKERLGNINWSEKYATLLVKYLDELLAETLEEELPYQQRNVNLLTIEKALKHAEYMGSEIEKSNRRKDLKELQDVIETKYPKNIPVSVVGITDGTLDNFCYTDERITIIDQGVSSYLMNRWRLLHKDKAAPSPFPRSAAFSRGTVYEWLMHGATIELSIRNEDVTGAMSEINKSIKKGVDEIDYYVGRLNSAIGFERYAPSTPKEASAEVNTLIQMIKTHPMLI